MFMYVRLKEKMTIISFTHSDTVMRMSDLVYVIEAGEVAERGSYADLVSAGVTLK